LDFLVIKREAPGVISYLHKLFSSVRDAENGDLKVKSELFFLDTQPGSPI